MNAAQNYLCMFAYLSEFYDRHVENHQGEVDDLGGLLGSMNPFLFSGNLPADHAIAEDWNVVIGNKGVRISATTGFYNMIRLLEFQRDNFKIDLAFVLNSLKSVSCGTDGDPGWRRWLEHCDEAIRAT